MAHRGSDSREVAKGGRGGGSAGVASAHQSHVFALALSLTTPPASNAGRVIHNQKSVLIL